MRHPQGGTHQKDDNVPKSLNCTLIAAASLAAFALPAGAQTSPPNDEGKVENIVITATRREDGLQDVPAAVTAIRGAQLASDQIVDIKALSARAPSLLITDTPVGKNNMIIGMRGITPTSISSNNDPTVGIYVNGVYYARTAGANAALVDMERVEVIRGPQGTLFGRNTIGGALNMTTRRPTDKLEGSVGIGLGDHGQRSANGVLNLPLGDMVSARLVLDHQEHGGYGRSTTLNEPLSDDKSDYLRASLRIRPTQSLDIDLYHDRFKSDANSQVWILTYFDPKLAAGSLAGLGPYVQSGGFDNTAGFNPRNTVAVENTAATATWHAPAFTLKSISAYRHLDSVSGYDLDATPLFVNQIQRYGVAGHQLTQELQAYGTAISDQLDWITGLYYLDERIQDSSLVTQPSGTNTLGRLNQFTVDQRSVSAFAQLTYSLSKDLHATAGLRSVHDTRGIDYYPPRYLTSTGAQLAGASGCPLIAAGLDQGGCHYRPADLSFNYTPWTAGLDFRIDRQNMVYGKLSSGFRSGGFQPAGATTAAGYAPFDEEKVLSLELGSKSVLLDGTVRLNLAAYLSKYKDIQQIAPHIPAGSTVSVSSVFNAGDATVKGLEADMQWRIGKLDLTGSLGLMDPQFTSGPYQGQPFVTAAKTTYTLGADYPLALAVGKLTLHADYSWRSKVSFFVPVNTNTNPFAPLTAGQIDSNEQAAYGLLNAMATLELNQPRLRLSVWGRNLTNQYYKARSNSFYLQGYNTITPGDPRTVGATLDYRF